VVGRCCGCCSSVCFGRYKCNANILLGSQPPLLLRVGADFFRVFGGLINLNSWQDMYPIKDTQSAESAYLPCSGSVPSQSHSQYSPQVIEVIGVIWSMRLVQSFKMTPTPSVVPKGSSLVVHLNLVDFSPLHELGQQMRFILRQYLRWDRRV